MRELQFLVLNVFTQAHFGGNPLAVVPEAAGLSDSDMQSLARQFNLAETTFVLPPVDRRHAARVRIFTPVIELPFAGHPTVGTAIALATLGRGDGDFVLEEGIGPVGVSVRTEAGVASADFTLSGGVEAPDALADLPALASSLSLADTDVVDGWFGSAGVPICFVRLTDRAAVDRAVLDRGNWTKRLADAWSRNLYVFAGNPGEEPLYARFFAPALGVDEDPATGAAAAALVGSLALRERARLREGLSVTIEQGTSMGRPSVIRAAARFDDATSVHVSVGGSAFVIARGTIDVPA